MKRTRKHILILLTAAIMMAGCKSNAAPQANSPTTAAALPGEQTASAPLAGEGSGSGKNEPQSGAPQARPTSPAVPPLAGDFPTFDGLYWTGEVGVEPLGENAVRVVTGLPCESLLGLISSGEWAVVEQAVPKAEQSGVLSTLARLEKEGQSAYVEIRDTNAAPLVIEGQPAPTPAPVEDPLLEGCSGVLQVLPTQQVEAGGDEQAVGQALQYPLGTGCMFFDESASVSLYYEGPEDFRAAVEFTIPAAPGEYSADEADISLEAARSGLSLVERFAEMYARGVFQDGDESFGNEYYASSETAGTVTVTSTDPLAGEINLTDFASESGESQTFRAGFQCAAEK